MGLLFGQEPWRWIVRTIAVCLVIQLLLTPELWGWGERMYPSLPIFSFLRPLFAFSFYFLILLLALLIWMIIDPRRLNIRLGLAVLLTLVCLDITRLQVWIYLWCSLLFVVSWPGQLTEISRFNAMRWIVIAVYFWGGLHKFNVYFVEDNLPWMLEAIHLQNWHSEWLAGVIAAGETLLGIGLIWPKTRRLTVGGVLIFHLIVLAILGPFGQNWNTSVWPWNITMVIIVYLLFYDYQTSLFRNFKIQIATFPLLLPVFFLFGLAPILNDWKKWDEQLSFKMYAGTNPEGIFYYYDAQPDCFPAVTDTLVIESERTGKKHLILDEWAFAEFNAAPYASAKHWRKVARQICRCVDAPERSGLEILWPDRWRKDHEFWEKIPCSELLNAD